MGAGKLTEDKIGKKRRDIFFKVLSETGIMQAACFAAGIDRRTAYRVRERDAEWAADWTDALETAADSLEQEAIRRGRDGVLKYVISMGKMVIDQNTGDPLQVREYSDKMLELTLKGSRPSKYNPQLHAPTALPADLAPDPEPTPDEDGPEKPIL